MEQKYIQPTSHVQAPFKTIWHVVQDSKQEYWIQVSRNQEIPKWIRLGDLFEQDFDKKRDENRIDEFLGE